MRQISPSACGAILARPYSFSAIELWVKTPGRYESCSSLPQKWWTTNVP